jgi:hypothetical protein
MANFLDFPEITTLEDLSGGSKIVGVQSDDSEEQIFSIDLLFEKFKTELTTQSLSGSENSPLLDLSSTWNTTETVTALKLNVTDTASGGNSLLLALQKNGTTVCSVRKDGWLVTNFGLGCENFYSTGGGQTMVIGSIAGIGNSVSVINALGLGGGNLSIVSPSSSILQLGGNHSTTPTTQTIKAHDVVTGSGASLVISGGNGSTVKGNVILDGGNRNTYDSSLYSSFSTIATIFIKHGLMALCPPLNISASDAGAGTASVSWNAEETGVAEHYEVQTSLDGVSYTALETTSGTTSSTMQGQDIMIYFRVRSVFGQLTSDWETASTYVA